MVNPGAFQGARKEFLLGKKPNYALAVDEGYAADRLAAILRRYFKQFPIDLPDDQQPTEEHLAAVDDDAAEPDVQEPDPAKMTPEEFEVATKELKDRQRRLAFKKAQIKRWMAYQYRKDHDLDATESGVFNQYRILLAKLTKKDFDRPRLKTPVNVWRKTQRAVIEGECRKIVDAAKDKPLEPGQKKECLIAMRSRIATAMFGKLTEEERTFWELEAAAEHELALARWKEEMKAPISTEPAARQRCIQGLIQFAQPILDLISEATGWKVSMIAGGPEPAHGGQFNVISIHSGTTSGDVKMNFGRAERARFRSTIVPLYGSFLRKCYRPEECRARALPKDEGYIPMIEQDLDNENAACDTVDWETQSTGTRSSTPATSASASENPPKASVAPRSTKNDSKRGASQSGTKGSKKPSRAGAKGKTAASETTAPVIANQPDGDTATSTTKTAPGPSVQKTGPVANSTTPASADSTSPVASVQTVAASSADSANEAPAVRKEPHTSNTPTLAASTSTPAPAAADDAPTPSVKSIGPLAIAASNIVDDAASPANDDTNDNPFPFHLEDTPAPSSPAPSLPPSPAHSPRHSPVRTVQQASAPPAAPMDVDEEILPHPGSTNAVGRRSRRLAQPAMESSVERASGAKSRKRGAEEDAPTAEGAAKGGQVAKKPRISTAPAAPASTEPSVKVPSDAAAWFVKAMAMFTSSDFGTDWQALLNHWSTFEASENYSSSGHLPATHRPTAVKDWIQRARSTTWRPNIASADGFGTQFMQWWEALQPKWRRSNGGTMMAPNAQEVGWEAVRIGGANGLLSVVAALFFWGVAGGQNDNQAKWLTAVKDVDAVLMHFISN